MTGIAALCADGEVWMAGDSAAVEQSHYLIHDAQSKVFVNGPCVIGFTSSFRMGRALRYRLVVPKLPKDQGVEALDQWVAVDFADAVRAAFQAAGFMRIENGREYGGQFLLGVRGSLYVFDDDFQAERPVDGFAAVGAGVSVILGALFASKMNDDHRDRLMIALIAAERFTTSVRGPFQVVRL